MNAEGYPDPTADKAIKRADKAPEQVSELIRTIKAVAGFDIVGRIELREHRSGRIFK